MASGTPARTRSIVKGVNLTRDQVQENALFIFPGHAIPTDWFSNPIERVKRAS
jgi:hypothetical protein